MSEAASSSNFPFGTATGEGRSAPLDIVDDSGGYSVLQESDASEAPEKNQV